MVLAGSLGGWREERRDAESPPSAGVSQTGVAGDPLRQSNTGSLINVPYTAAAKEVGLKWMGESQLAAGSPLHRQDGGREWRRTATA